MLAVSVQYMSKYKPRGVPHQQTSNISIGRTLHCHVKAINIYKTKISIHCVLMKEKNLM